jgi:hypothetical protein
VSGWSWTALPALEPRQRRNALSRLAGRGEEWSFCDLDGALEVVRRGGDGRPGTPPSWHPDLFGGIRPGAFERLSCVASARAAALVIDGAAGPEAAAAEAAAMYLGVVPDAGVRGVAVAEHQAWLVRAGADLSLRTAEVESWPDGAAVAAYRVAAGGLGHPGLARAVHTQVLRLCHPWSGPGQLGWEHGILAALA